jgi:hypothetical protein
VREAGVAPGEDAALRQRLRRMEARAAAVQRCGLVGAALGAEAGGVGEGLRGVATQLRAVLADEEAYAAAESSAQPGIFVGLDPSWRHLPRPAAWQDMVSGSWSARLQQAFLGSCSLCWQACGRRRRQMAQSQAWKERRTRAGARR